MAATVTISRRQNNSIQYQLVEAGTAAAADSRDVNTDLAAANAVGIADQPISGQRINEILQPATPFADQAAARAALQENFDVDIYFRAVTGGAVVPTVDADVSAPAVATNFRLVILPVKTNDTDTATYFVRLSLRHSLIA